MDIQVEVMKRTLQTGDITLAGEFVWGSNHTFLVHVVLDSVQIRAVYKPNRGERPLWDFPPATLAKREVAAYLVSQLIKWDLVPPTIYRKNGPFGPGSLQLYVDHDPELHYFNLSEAQRTDINLVVAFDLLINNADRKASHVILDHAGHLWLIDHGVCFHSEDKLRTVIWELAGNTIPDNILKDIKDLITNLKIPNEISNQLKLYLSKLEYAALITRSRNLVEQKIFPNPPEERRPYPWPPI